MAAKTKDNWAQLANGALCHMRKPLSLHREDEHLEVVLAYVPKGFQKWVTWTHNREDGSCFGGNYFDEREQAVIDFVERGNLRLVPHNQDPEEDTVVEGDGWEKVKKPVPLGSDQSGMLRVLMEKRSWYLRCGWNWGSLSLTRRVLSSLEKRGLIQRHVIAGRDTYKIAPHAEELFVKSTVGNWWHYKDGAIQELRRPRR